ncbi:hypothetical protein D3C81_1596510 [compost metagenome]
MPNGADEEGRNARNDICNNPHDNHCSCGIFFRQITINNCTRESNNLNHQQNSEQSKGVQSIRTQHGRSIGHYHFNNGIYPVNIEKVSEQENKHNLVLSDIFKGASQSDKAVDNRSGLRLKIMSLLYILNHWNGQQSPPESRNNKSNLITDGLVHSHEQY